MMVIVLMMLGILLRNLVLLITIIEEIDMMIEMELHYQTIFVLIMNILILHHTN